jgi:GDPmannose 4,6-dehydratase
MDRLEIYNLGAMSHVKVSFEMPEYTGNIDGLGVLRLLEAIRSTGLQEKTRYYQASTSELYGKVQETPQTEKTPFYPRSPYGVAKLASYWATINFRESYNIFSCNGILFNHGSTRRGFDFFERKLSSNVAKIKLGLIDHISFGNLTSSRDLGCAKDYVVAMDMMLNMDKPEEFVIATGKTYLMSEMVKIMFEIAEIKGYENYIKVDEKMFRPSEVDVLLGDPTKAKNVLGWNPRYDIYSLFEEMYKNDLELLKS